MDWEIRAINLTKYLFGIYNITFYVSIRICRQFVTKKWDFFYSCFISSCIFYCFIYIFVIFLLCITIMKFVIVDIETTWLSAYKHGITEIAAVRFNGKNIEDSFQTLVHPERHIPTFITRLTGITNDMVADAMPIDSVLPDFLEFLWEDIFVAHNASFDIWFLNHAHYQKLGSYIQNPVLCTRKLTRYLTPELPKRNLGFLCEHFWITNNRAHRALSDVHATTELLQHFLNIAEKQGKSIDDLLSI